MRDTPCAELQNTIHFKNRSVVRATCPDCHVPKEWIYKAMAKIEATTDLYHHILGHVDTPAGDPESSNLMLLLDWHASQRVADAARQKATVQV